MALTNDQITAQNFKSFYNQIRPYLNGTAHGGFTPIGTVISVMGKQAPHNYLVCDGTVYNIADYPELAAYFTGQFEASNFFGGDGITTFAVPDLRGEFLRGSGTNSHPRSGDGADVGIHQEGTMNPFTMVLDNATNDANQIAVDPTLSENPNSSAPHWWGAANTDYKSITNNKLWRNPTTTSGMVDTTGTYPSGYVARPTNTSVLYCIATKNIFMDAGCNYSTDEQVVGTWIDGKPIYQKTFTSVLPTATTMGSIVYSYIDIGAQVETIVDQIGKFHTLSNGLWHDTIFDMDINSGWNYAVKALVYDNSIPNNANKILVGNADTAWNGAPLHITIRYTKLTD